MRELVAFVLYTALGLGANPGVAGPSEALALIAAENTGDMRKLLVHAVPRPVPEAELLDAAGAVLALSDWRGQWVVLNFWATWCAPCRWEMPSLLRLQAAMPAIAVLPVATGRNPLPAIQRFYQEAGVGDLPILRDEKSTLAHAMGVMGLPVTVILDPQGQEVARLIGDAEWDTAQTLAVLAALMSGD